MTRTARIEFADDPIFCKPIFIDKHGPAYKKSDVEAGIIKEINIGNHFSRRLKTMTTDINNAIKETEAMTEKFSLAFDRFLEKEKNLVEQSKKSFGAVRDANEKLANGLAKVEKTVNFDKLERMVILLERAAEAMNKLAELDRDGKLERISSALK